MITFFTTAKPFRGHLGVIQNNALRSWKLLGPDVEVILFGDDEGSAEAAARLGLRHEPNVERNEQGTNLVSSLFEKAQQIAKHDLVCYCNCDIVVTNDFRRAASLLQSWQSRFLMVGRRWDTDITAPIDFSQASWEKDLLALAHSTGFQRAYFNIDYFLFTKGLYQDVPPFAIGRLTWDNWLVWKVRELQVPIVDASAMVCAVHQNHDYSHHPQGMQGVWEGEEARRNVELVGPRYRSRTIEDATYKLTEAGPVKNGWYWLAPAKRRWRGAKRHVSGAWRTWVWHPLLDLSRPVRRALGLRQSAVPGALRSSKRRHPMDW